MTDSSYTRSLAGDDREPELVGSYRTNSFFELYNNQRCIKNDLTGRKTRAENSLNRSEDDDESNLNDDDLNFDDLDDFGAEPRDLTNEIHSEDSEPDEDEELDKFDVNDQENLAEENLNGIAIGRGFRRQRSNSRTIHEDELSVSMKQYAKSMPVDIPNDWKPFSTNRDRKSRNGFSVKEDNPNQNIAESIRALAKSVREDEYELFGELPSRRFNASEIVRNRN